jgi:hypothetical protein
VAGEPVSGEAGEFASVFVLRFYALIQKQAACYRSARRPAGWPWFLFAGHGFSYDITWPKKTGFSR